MKWVTYRSDHGERTGVLSGDAIYAMPPDVSLLDLVGRGADGGIGAGLLAVGGRYQSGAAIIAEHTHFADDLADAELIVTGEGRFDEQSLHGKVVGAIAAAARPLAIPVIVLAGQVSLDKSALRSAGIMAALSIAEYAGSVRLALADAANQLMGLASQVAARLGNSGPSGYR